MSIYAVHSKNTGALVCGPYDSRADARRECDRLNREARTGRTAPSDLHPEGQALSGDGGPIMHRVGLAAPEPQAYEVITSGTPNGD